MKITELSIVWLKFSSDNHFLKDTKALIRCIMK